MKLTARCLPLLLFALATGVAHAGQSLIISDLGAISGLPGQVTGYGFTFINNSPNYAVLDDSYLDFTPAFTGTYADFLANNFIEIAPNGTFTQAFSYVLGTTPGNTIQNGTGLLTINSNAAAGATASGNLIVDYDLYNGDPLVGFTQATYGNETSAAVSITVSKDAPLSLVPEPANLPLFSAVLLLCSFLVSRKMAPTNNAVQAKTCAAQLRVVRSFFLGGMLLLGLCAFSQTARADQTDPFQILTSTDIQNECTPQNADKSSTDWNGCCGAPGRRGCFVGFSSQAFSSNGGVCDGPGNQLRVDSYSSSVLCNLTSPSYDPAVAKLFQTQPPGQDFTLYVTSDIHFFRTTFNLTDQLTHVSTLNSFDGSGKNVWPPGTGALSGTTIATPVAVVVDGDITTHAQAADLGAFRLNYEEGAIPASLKYPVLFGLGNHDINTNVNDSASAQRMFDYLTARMNAGSNFDTNSGNYSWDWQGVHMVQLNTWAGDQTSKYSRHTDGLNWLASDLKTHVGNTTQPVIIFQHYGFNQVANGQSPWWPINDAALNNNGQPNGTGYESFWQVIHNYNVLALFSGHSHCLGNYTSQVPAIFLQNEAAYNPFTLSGATYTLTSSSANPGMSGTYNYGALVDNFDDGSGGDNTACSSQNALGTFLTAHVSNHYLDVAQFGWRADGAGPFADPSNGFTNLTKPSPEAACRRRINSQFIPAPTSAISVTQTYSQTGYTVTNTSGHAIAGPVALQFTETTLVDADFVDQCAGGNGAGYVLVNGENGLAPGQSYSVTFSNGDTTLPKPVLLTPLSGVIPTGFNFVTAYASANNVAIAPDPQTLTAYGPPNAAFTVSLNYFDSTTGWLNVPATGNFDATGTATIQISFVSTALTQTSLGNLTASVNITTPSTSVVESALVEITFKAPLSLTLTANPPDTAPVGTEPVFTAILNYPKLQDQDGASIPATGLVNLMSQSTFLSAAVVNDSSCLDGKLDLNPPQPDNVIFGGLPSTSPQACPSSTMPSGHINAPDANPNDQTDWWYSSSLAPGVYSIDAAYIGSGAGDSDYVPATSNSLLYRIGDPLLNAGISSGDAQSAPVHGYFQIPLAVQVTSQSNTSGGPANAVVTFTVQPGVDKEGGTFAGKSSATVVAGANGIATAPILLATSSIPGPWSVIATIGGLPNNPLQFNLRSVASGAVPLLHASFTGKSGSLASRVWTMTLANLGTAAAGAVTVNGFTLSQEAGAACTPVIGSGVPFTLPLISSLAGSNSASANITIDFSSCAATSRFTVLANVTSNGGAYTTPVNIGHQFP